MESIAPFKEGIDLVKEAGGKISSGKGGEYKFESSVLIASNKLIHDNLIDVLSGLENDHVEVYR